MKLKSFIYELCLSHLKNTIYDKIPEQLLSNDDYDIKLKGFILTILSFIQEGLLDLYTTFPIITKRIDIEIYEAITTYMFSKEYAESYRESHSDNPTMYSYIKDSKLDPFKEDIIKILSVYDDNGSRYRLNDLGTSFSIFTYTPTSLYIPYPVTGKLITVEYQASHPDLINSDLLAYSKLTKEMFDKLLLQDLLVPTYFIIPLKYYVSAKIYGIVNGQESLARVQEYLSQYQIFKDQNKALDIANINTSTTTSNKVYISGLY